MRTIRTSLFTAELLTPTGMGAVGVIRACGPNIYRSVLPLLRRKDGSPFVLTHKESPQFALFSLSDTAVHTITEDTFEEVVLYCRDHDTVEIHCHGGVAVCDILLRTLKLSLQKYEENVHLPTHNLPPAILPTHIGTYCSDTFVHAEHPLAVHIRECGFSLLPQVKTEFAVRLILGQCQGLLYNACVQLAELAVHNRMEAEHQYGQLQNTIRWGCRLTVPFRVVLAGPPNVGKSSLMNTLVGFDRTITDSVPGTTRDTVSHHVVYNGWEFMLWDTAGIRHTSDPIEQEGCRRTRELLRTADTVLWISDSTTVDSNNVDSNMDTATKLAVTQEKTCVYIHVLNKIDLLEQTKVEYFRQQRNSIHQSARNSTQNDSPLPIVPVSAATGEGVSDVLEAVYRSVLPPSSSLRIPFLFSPQLELTPFGRLLEWF